MLNQNIKVWAQMFFDDGSVTQGIRVDADIIDSDIAISELADKLLDSVNRDEGHLLIWGAGSINAYDIVIDPSESDLSPDLDFSDG